MPDGELGTEASFQLILSLTSSVAVLQHDMDRVTTDLRALHIETTSIEKERQRCKRDTDAEIARLEAAIVAVNNFTPQERRAILRGIETDEGNEMRRMGLRWPIIVGLLVVVVAAAVNVAVALLIHAVGG
jgi:hypothetical protein